MNDDARAALRELVVRYGTSLADDPRRTKALLQDRLRGEHRLAIALIETAAVEGVPGELLRLPAGGDLVEIRLGQLARQLERERGLAPEAARWAVETWAAALEPEPEPEPAPEPGPEPEQKPEPAPEAVVQQEAHAPVDDRPAPEGGKPVVIQAARDTARSRRRSRLLTLGLPAVGAVAALTALLFVVARGPSAEDELRQHIPRALGSCKPREGREGAEAAIRCFSVGGTLVDYFAFANPTAMSAWLDDNVTSWSPGSCRAGESLSGSLPYRVGGEDRGRVFCTRDDDTFDKPAVYVYWTDRRYNIAGESDEFDQARLDEQVDEWACCLGPVEKPTDQPAVKTLGESQ